MKQPASLYDYAEHMAGLVGRDWLDDVTASGCIALFAAQRHRGEPDLGRRISGAVQFMKQRAERIHDDHALAEHRIRRAVWPLCEERRPGGEILAAAERAAFPARDVADHALQPDDILIISRRFARQATARRHRGRR